MITKTIGRDSNCDIVIDEQYSFVSRFHCTLKMDDSGDFSITDDKSTNGTFVKGRLIRGTVRIKPGDKIRLGGAHPYGFVLNNWEEFFIPKHSDFGLDGGSAKVSSSDSVVPPVASVVSPKEKKPSIVYAADIHLADIGLFKHSVEQDLDRLRAIVVSFGNDSKLRLLPHNIAASEYCRKYEEVIQEFKKILESVSIKAADFNTQYQVSQLWRRRQISDMLISDQDRAMKMQGEYEKDETGYQSLKLDLCRMFLDLWDELEKNSARYLEDYEETRLLEDCDFSLNRSDDTVSCTFMAGNNIYTCNLFGQTIEFRSRNLINLFLDKHLVIKYDNASKYKAVNLVNNLVVRALATSPFGGIEVAMIDAEGMDGTCPVFKLLNREVFRLLATDEIRQYLDNSRMHIENVIRNLLQPPLSSLYEYNLTKETKIPYRLIVIEDFPVGLSTESMLWLKEIFKNGIKAGVQVILMQNEDIVQRSEEERKQSYALGLNILENNYTLCELDGLKREALDIQSLSDRQLQAFVQGVNRRYEVKKEPVLNLREYIHPETEWWKGNSCRFIEVPFGISDDMSIQSLRISQENGQNSALVIGIPGSGKSVFLHSLISNAVMNYSPDELGLYLIDFSGVEFNTYAIHNLPHAKVIAPEAEREFGLSILAELVEEGMRRMELCREHNVKSIVDLREKQPTIILPRLLVIIDEFQKLLEAGSDSLSRNMADDAAQKIQTIVQEYRKFGINLILATQRLQGLSALPKNLMANRVVFNCEPNDFSSLITWPSGIPRPILSTGRCVYNAESGAPNANILVRGFNVPEQDTELILTRMKQFNLSQGRKENVEMRVFRGGDLPDYYKRKILSKHKDLGSNPDEVGAYLGESIAISENDVYISLSRNSGNNILIIGGAHDVAEPIAFFAEMSLCSNHSAKTAQFFTFNFLRSDNPLSDRLDMEIEGINEHAAASLFVSEQSDVLDVLEGIKSVIENRVSSKDDIGSNIYITILGFQLARVFDKFDKGGFMGEEMSEESKILQFILKNGPLYGVFTILQVEDCASLSRVEGALSLFCHRVVLQMSEVESQRIMDSVLASNLSDRSRPNSKYRAYYRNNSQNITVKFKPYKYE